MEDLRRLGGLRLSLGLLRRRFGAGDAEGVSSLPLSLAGGVESRRPLTGGVTVGERDRPRE